MSVALYVLDVPEFQPLVEAARATNHCRIIETGQGYTRIEADQDIVFNRKQMKMKPAVWYGLFTGGLEGRIAAFGREEVRISEDLSFLEES